MSNHSGAPNAPSLAQNGPPLANAAPAAAAAAATFDQLVSAYVDELAEAQPVTGSALGIPECEYRLDERSLDALHAAQARNDDWLARFEALPSTDLTLDQQLDRELVTQEMRARQALREREGFRSNPVPYVNLGLGAVAGIFERRLLPDDELAAAACARMAAIPEAMRSGLDLVEPGRVAPLHAQRALRVCQAARLFFTQLPDVAPVPDADRERLSAMAEATVAAYQSCEEVLRRIAGEAAGDWRLGASLYEELLRFRHGVDLTCDELYELGQDALDQETANLARVRSTAAAKASPGGRPRFAILDERLAYLAGEVDAARAWVVEQDLVTLPAGESCGVRTTPLHLRATSSAMAYRASPVLSDSLHGWFDVPGPQIGAAPPTSYGRPGASRSTVVHETYPGHHVHNVRQKGHVRILRSLIRTPFFSEGWAFYCEAMMSRTGFLDDPVEQISHHLQRQRRAGRIVLDVGLHTGRMTPEEAVTMMRTSLGVSAAAARSETERYCANPIQAVSYYLGGREFEQMAVAAERHGLSLREFHDTITTIGAPPLRLAERLLAARVAERAP